MDRPLQIKIVNAHGERLYRAVENENFELVRNLVGLAQDKDISQALIGAVIKNNIKLVEYLISVGAKMGLYNKLSYRIAQKMGHTEIIEIFEKIIKHSKRIGNINPNVRELIVPRLKPVAERTKIEKHIENMLPIELIEQLTKSGLRVKISAIDKNLDVAICNFNRRFEAPIIEKKTTPPPVETPPSISLLNRVKNKSIGFEFLTSKID